MFQEIASLPSHSQRFPLSLPSMEVDEQFLEAENHPSTHCTEASNQLAPEQFHTSGFQQSCPDLMAEVLKQQELLFEASH